MGIFTPLYMKDALSAEQVQKAVEAVRALTDPAKLSAVATDAKDAAVRLAAIEKLTDAALLGKIALESPSGQERMCAVKNPHLTDQVLLAQVAIRDESDIVGRICVKDKISDPALLGKIALEAPSGSVRQLAVRHAYFNDAALLEKIAVEDADAAVRTAAVENTALSSPDALERIASASREDGSLEPRWTAALKLSRRDPDRAAHLLLDLIESEASQDGSWLRNETLEFLNRYCRTTKDEAFRQAAEQILKRYGKA